MFIAFLVKLGRSPQRVLDSCLPAAPVAWKCSRQPVQFDRDCYHYFSNGRCFRRTVRGRAVIVGSRRSEAICAVTAEPASVLKMTHARITALPWSKLNMRASCSTIAHVGRFAAE